jgi:hypothetical protein
VTINRIRDNATGTIEGNIHQFDMESFTPLGGATQATIFIGFDAKNGRTSAELNFARDEQQSYDDGILHLYFPSEMMAPILQFLSETVPSTPGEDSFAVINFEYKSAAKGNKSREVDNTSISLVDRRWCR